MTDVRKCDVCGEVREVFVAASPLGPISQAYCMPCGHAGAQPYGTLVAGLYGCLDQEGNLVFQHELEPIVEASLQQAGKTRAELVADIRKFETEYEAAMAETEVPPAWDHSLKNG